MTSFNRFMALTAFPALLAYAQDISGDWQGTLKAGAQELRTLLQIAKSDNGEWKATMLSIDQSPDPGHRHAGNLIFAGWFQHPVCDWRGAWQLRWQTQRRRGIYQRDVDAGPAATPRIQAGH